ncbi:MAG TPA: response regulator [Alphaproteobacteria bacterium]|nr:response regulator [Alphaproteobacteria bacterium]
MLPPPVEAKAFITILIAEDNVVSREMMAGILNTQGYKTIPANDGDEAIAIIQKQDVDLALVDINMAPTGGFEFVKYLLVNGIDVPVVVVTADDSSDMLIEASSLSVQRVLQKPIQPARLLDTVSKILKRRGLNPTPMGVEAHDAKFSHEALMARAVELAHKNAQSKKGGPFGAVLADANGKILGEGVNGITSRSDPTAHAEVMAIRQAAERLGRSDLSDCILYVSSEPTMIGRALIQSVGIATVYYGLSHAEVGQLRAKTAHLPETRYEQLGHDAAAAMFMEWAGLKDKVAD